MFVFIISGNCPLAYRTTVYKIWDKSPIFDFFLHLFYSTFPLIADCINEGNVCRHIVVWLTPSPICLQLQAKAKSTAGNGVLF